MTTIPKGAKSYVLLDNTNSPVAISQRMPNGEILTVAAGEKLEAPALTCSHCSSVVVLNPLRTRERKWCRRCGGYLCGRPGCVAECNFTLEMIDLGLRYPDQPTLLRDEQGNPLYDTSLRDRHRLH